MQHADPTLLKSMECRTNRREMGVGHGHWPKVGQKRQLCMDASALMKVPRWNINVWAGLIQFKGQFYAA